MELHKGTDNCIKGRTNCNITWHYDELMWLIPVLCVLIFLGVVLYRLGGAEALAYGMVVATSWGVGLAIARISGNPELDWLIVIAILLILRFGGWWVFRKLRTKLEVWKRNKTPILRAIKIRLTNNVGICSGFSETRWFAMLCRHRCSGLTSGKPSLNRDFPRAHLPQIS